MARRPSSVRLDVTSSFPQFRKQIHSAIREGIERGSVAGAGAARSATPRGDGRTGYLPGHAANTLQAMKLQKRKRGGYRGGFGSHDPTFIWLCLGTSGRRRRRQLADTKPGATPTPTTRGTGIRPNHAIMRRPLFDVALPTAIAVMKARGGTGRIR